MHGLPGRIICTGPRRRAPSPEPVHHVARAQNLPDATPLPRAKPAKRNEIGLVFFAIACPAAFIWASHISEGLLLLR